MNSFHTENSYDRLRIYDGTSDTDPLLLMLTGSTSQQTVTATSGSMFLKFTSDGSVTAPGFDFSWTSEIPSSAPTASISTDTSIAYNTPHQFISTSSIFVADWQWDFGDGTSSTEEHPTKSYTSSGTYTVRLIVDNCFDVDTTYQDLSVQSPPGILIQPDTLFSTVNCGEADSQSFTILNQGPGDLVVTSNSPSNTEAGLSILAFTYGTDYDGEYDNVKSTILTSMPNVTIEEVSSASPSELAELLAEHSFLLIPELEDASTTYLSQRSDVIIDFVEDGGSVLMCGNLATRVNALGLLTTTSVSNNSSGIATIVNPSPITDSLSASIALTSAVYFQNFTDPDYVSLVEYNNKYMIGEKEIGSGKVVYLGYDFFTTNTSSSELLVNSINYLFTNQYSWLSYTAVDSTLSSGDSINVSVGLDASTSYAGTYWDSILVASNDSLTPNYYVYVSMEVLGSSLISVDANLLNFDTIQQTTSTNDTLIVSNLACDTLFIDSLVYSNAAFSGSGLGNYILPYEYDTLIVAFSTADIDVFSDSLLIYNDDVLEVIYLEASSIGAPILSFSPSEISEAVTGCSDSITIPITLYNTGEDELIVNTNSSASNYLFYEGFESGNLNQWNLNSTSSVQITSNDPAVGGHCVRNPEYNFYNGLHTDLGNITPGYASVRIKTDNIGIPSAYYVIKSSEGQTAISLYNFNNLWRLVSDGNVVHASTIVPSQWYHFEFKNIDFSTQTFDFYIDGALLVSEATFVDYAIDFKALDLYSVNQFSLGEADYYDELIFSPEEAVPSWIDFSQNNFQIAVGDSVTFDLTLSAEGLNNGTYESDFILSSNDPNNPTDTIAISFTVDGDAQIEHDVANCIDFGDLIQFTSSTDTFELSNMGCDLLEIDTIYSNSGAYSFSNSLDSLEYGVSSKVFVSFNPQVVGNFNDVLTILNSDTTIQICLAGESLGAPIISTSQVDSVLHLTSCGVDSMPFSFYIHNIGMADLDWSTGQQSYSDDFDNGFGDIWESYNSVFVNANCGTYNNSAGALSFTGSGLGTRNIISHPLVIGPGTIEFFIESGECETPDPGENLILSYSTNGLTWTILNTYQTGIFNNGFTAIQEDIPEDAYSSTTKFRLHQASYNGANFDTWTVDEFNINSSSQILNGTTASGDSSLVNLWFNTTEWTNGLYDRIVMITSNDPQNQSLTIPFSILVEQSPCIEYLNDSIIGCEGLVDYSVDLTNSASSISWNFGDNNSATGNAVSHLYEAVGDYTMEVIACNTFGCDTLSTVLSITDVSGVPEAFCTPGSQNNYDTYGINSVVLNNISNPSSTTESGYQDFSCEYSTDLLTQTPYQITIVSPSGASNLYAKAWIDFNNNGFFESTEVILDIENTSSPFSSAFTVPNTNVVYDQKLRMRVATERSYSIPSSNPCSVLYGEFEDYSVVIDEINQEPNAAFHKSNIDLCEGLFQFIDQSEEVPTSWLWTFGDGESSETQHPIHQYQASGIYTIKLIASNDFGVDSTSQDIFIELPEAEIAIGSITSLNTPILFQNTTSGITEYLWSFGDGETSTLAAPSHAYADPYLYIVSLTATNSYDCSVTVFDTVDLRPLTIAELDDNQISLVPNPTTGMVYLINKAEVSIASIQLFSILGQSIKQFDYEDNTGEIELDLSNFENGIYEIRVSFTNQSQSVYKVIKKE
ncbi:MAG: PKD domain-containing protein [Flavobacteriales bacterium]